MAPRSTAGVLGVFCSESKECSNKAMLDLAIIVISILLVICSVFMGIVIVFNTMDRKD